MSQNSHEYGQPLENWMLAMKYSRRWISSYAGVIEVLDQPVGRVPQLAEVQHVRVEVVLGAARHGGTAEHHGPAVGVGARDHVVDARPLHVHARDEDGIGPAEVVVGGRARVLVDEADLPLRGQ